MTHFVKNPTKEHLLKHQRKPTHCILTEFGCAVSVCVTIYYFFFIVQNHVWVSWLLLTAIHTQSYICCSISTCMCCQLINCHRNGRHIQVDLLLQGN